MMGMETSIPPFAMDAAPPEERPAAASNTGFLGTCTCPARGPETGSAHMNCKHFTDFHGFGVNRMGSCAFLQSKVF